MKHPADIELFYWKRWHRVEEEYRVIADMLGLLIKLGMEKGFKDRY